MSRAAPLPPDERRQAILDAVLPLVLEQGLAISTKQIAQASGVAEGTIYKVFDTKSELLDEAIRAGLAPEALLDRMAALPSGRPVGEHVTALVRLLQQQALASHRLLTLLPPASKPHGHGTDRHGFGERTLAAIAAALEPHAAALRVPPHAAAGALLALSLGSAFSPDPVAPEGVASILLHGICLTESDPCS